MGLDHRPSVMESIEHPGWHGCPGHGRHWFTVRGHVGVRSPKCVRCGFPNPKLLTTDDWYGVLAHAPYLLEDPEEIRRALESDEG